MTQKEKNMIVDLAIKSAGSILINTYNLCDLNVGITGKIKDENGKTFSINFFLDQSISR